MVGGAARDPLWRRILTDAFGVPTVVLHEPESAALGAALQAAWTTGRARGEAVSIDELAQRFARSAARQCAPARGAGC